MEIFFKLLLDNPNLKHEVFEVMRDFRKGGLHPAMYKDFIDMVNLLPTIPERTAFHYNDFDKFKLRNVTKEDFLLIQRELRKRIEDSNKMCWHPLASETTCSIDGSGKIKVSQAHSIQNNGVLNKIVENGHVTEFLPYENRAVSRHRASIFWGFCNTHDAIFRPIEITSYTKTAEQNFLFAYRAFVVSYHRKREVFNNSDDNQWEPDLIENKRIFDEAILRENYSIIETEIFELPAFYPIASCNAFNLEFDFDGNSILHSDHRMENIYVTLLPTEKNTYFLISYFKQDKAVYGKLCAQLRTRNNLKLDISILLAHAENTYFKPTYYHKNVKMYEPLMIKLLQQITTNTVSYVNGKPLITSNTPSNILENIFRINLFKD